MSRESRKLVLLAAAMMALLLLGGCIVRTQTTGVVTSAPVVTAGGSASGVISYPSQRVRYPMSIDYPRTVNVYVQGLGLDPTVAVYDAYGNSLGFNDDGGNGLDSHLMLPLGPGSYVVEVAGYGSSTGSYTLTIQ